MQQDSSNRETKSGYRTVAIAIISLIVIVIILASILLRITVQKQVERAYLQGANDAGSPMETLQITENIMIDSAFLSETIAPVAKLTTYEYYYTKVGVYEKSTSLFKTSIKLPFTIDKSLYTYSGTIGAGIDIDDVEFEVKDRNKSIVIKYPAIKVLYSTMDKDFEFYDLKKATFNRSNLDDYEEFRKGLKESITKELSENEDFISKVQENTEIIIENLIKATGKVDEYEIVHKWPNN